MIYLFGILAVLAVAFGPWLWANWILRRHNQDRPDLPGTGGELASHLVDQLGLGQVTVERTDAGSHYDPEARAVRLEQRFFDGRSVSAVAVAAHEVGHAMQDRDDYGPLELRQRMVRNTMWVQKAARIALIAAPFAALFGRHPGLMLLLLAAGVLFMAVSTVVHLITLPVEFDASFSRALPVLEGGRYLEVSDMPAARNVLRACALTYVAGALVSMFNLIRWVRLIR